MSEEKQDTQTTDATDAPKDTTAKDAPKDTGKTPDSKTILETPPAILNADGTFTDKWRDSLPDELKGEESLAVFKKFPDLVTSYVNTKKLVGRNKIPIPTEKSGPEEWAAFWDAGGRPKTADDYKFDVPEDLKDLFPDDQVAAARKLAHEIGVSQRQFGAYMQYQVEQAVKLLEEQDRIEAQALQEAENLLRREFGAAYDERRHVARRLIEEAIPNEEKRMDFLQKFAKDPDFVRFASIVGARLVESQALIADMTKDTPGEALAKIKQLQATPGYMEYGSKMSKEEREAITAEINRLMKEVHPDHLAGQPRESVG